MAENKQHKPVPYEFVSPGFEGVYTGETSSSPIDETVIITERTTDDDGNVIVRWPVFTWTFPGQEKDWDGEIRHLNDMQAKLGPLDDDTRQIRAHIGSLVPCDSGLPVAVDELLSAIGRGKLSEPSFHNGCWCGGMWWEQQTTQPLQAESMRTMHSVLTGYLAGRSSADVLAEFPHAAGFVRRVFEWLGPRSQLTEVQQLMLERMLLTVEQFFKYGDMVHFRITDTAILEEVTAVGKDLFEEGGRGPKLDAEIAERAGLPKIGPTWEESQKNRDGISDPEKKALYEVCCDIASGVCTLSDCHHNTFRFIERWIHGIGTGQSDIPTRAAGAERERLARLLFGYVLGLDKWLLGVPMQFLLMGLGHVDLGFNPKNEVVRVYACLVAESTPVKQWLAACLWYNLSYAPIDRAHPAGLVRHQELTERAATQGASVRRWIDAAVGGDA